jgi:hypothetical protein
MSGKRVASVEEYLQALPEDRRAVVSKVRDLVNAHLPTGYAETINWGMIAWEVPLTRYPQTYNKQPLGYAALAANKSGYSLHLMCAYLTPELDQALRNAYTAAGRKLDMGKGCLRFRKVEDLLVEPLTKLIASTPVEAYIAHYEATRKK